MREKGRGKFLMKYLKLVHGTIKCEKVADPKQIRPPNENQ